MVQHPRDAVLTELFGEPPERPDPTKAVLLGTIVVTFTAGAVLGAVLTLRASRWAMIAPSIAIFAASAFAFYQRTMERTTEPPRPR